MLPGISGIEVCSQYRSAGGQAAILMLTARICWSTMVLQESTDIYPAKMKQSMPGEYGCVQAALR
jgi:hypothetical protein